MIHYFFELMLSEMQAGDCVYNPTSFSHTLKVVISFFIFSL